MSKRFPIVALTGSSGAGTTEVKRAFEHIFRHAGITAAVIEGDSFHRYDRAAMAEVVAQAEEQGENVTHFGPEGNLFVELVDLFREYAQYGTGKRRSYVHTDAEAERYGHRSGTFTEWRPLPTTTDLLFYEGLHGGLNYDDFDVASYVDLLIGVVPIINLEWIQKIHRDRAVRGYSAEETTKHILRRMHDYAHYIVPQFSLTDVNFQRIPTVDTSNPFATEDIPNETESSVVIHIRNRRKIQADFDYLLDKLSGAFLSRPDTIVVPGERYVLAMELIVTPIIERIMDAKTGAEET